MKLTQSHLAYKLLVTLCLGYFLIMTLLGIDRHWSFKTSINDTGVFDQAIWNALQNGVLLETINLSVPINWLGFHFHPILFLFVPLYKISSTPIWLILIQSLAITLTTFPIYKTALYLNYRPWPALLCSIGFLLNPFVINAALWDFHPVAIATPLIALSIFFVLSNNFKGLLICIFILFLCQEQFGMVACCIGISYYLVNKDFNKAICLISIGVFYTLILFFGFFPLLSPTGTHIMMSPQVTNLNRYGWLGQTIPDIASHLLSSPLSILKTVLYDLEVHRYVFLLLLPYGLLLPLLGFEVLLIGAVDFAVNALSLIPLQRSIYSYHSITLIPLITIAAMIGFKRLSKIASAGFNRRIIVLSAAAFFLLLINSLPLMFGKESLWRLSPFPVKNPELEKIKKIIPANAVISVQANIGAHFSQRETVYAYPNMTNAADYIILNMEDPNGIGVDNTFRFIHHMRMNQGNYIASIKCLLATQNYQISYFNPPWMVLNKNPGSSAPSNHSIVNDYLERLAKRWEIENTNPLTDKCIWTQ
jgi:uncharacterized membrane protein